MITSGGNRNPANADPPTSGLAVPPRRIGLKRLRPAAVTAAGRAFVQNLRRGHYELATGAPPTLRLTEAFAELAHAV